MSVIPLRSLGVPETAAGEQIDYTPPPGTTDDAKLDAVVSKALEHIPDDDAPPPPRKSLDETISEGLDRQEAAHAEEESFKASREARDELNSRYGSQGDLATTIDQYIAWAKYFKESPQEAGQKFAESYLRASPYALKDHQPKQKVEPYIDPGGKRYSGRVLDDVLSNAIDKASSEKKDFVATAAQREALKQIFPGKTFDEALRTIVKIDRDAYADPLGTAATIAASFGLPVTPSQVARHNKLEHLGNQIDQALPTMPGLEHPAIQQQVLDVLARPDFFRSGDHIADLRRAHAVTQKMAQQDQQLGGWVEAELNKMDPALAKTVEDTILRDPSFQHQAKTNNQGRFGDPSASVQNFELARGIALQKMRAVAKAQRVRPVKSSSGAVAPTGGKGLDGHLSAALRDWK
jgi:hypothetical protein